ncbi:MAG: hypothetical protein R2878_02300 [Thermoleophilia bacterium]
MPDVTHEHVRTATRHAFAVVGAGVLGAIVWEIIVQEAFKMGHSVQNVNDGIGQFFATPEDEIRRMGLWATLTLGIVVALVHAVGRRFVNLRWWQHGAITAAGLYLVWAFVFSPLVDGSAEGIPGGIGAADTSLGTHLSILVAAVATGMMITRAYDLMRTSVWYEVKHYDIRESVDAVFGNVPTRTESKEREDHTS